MAEDRDHRHTRLSLGRRLLVMPLLICVLVLAIVASAHSVFVNWVMTAPLPPLNVTTSQSVVDRHGHLLRPFTVADGRWRLPQSVERINPDYLSLLLAYEDRRFYRHAGVDLQALMRAVLQAVQYQELVSGGSTLTMQVVRLLDEQSTRSWSGKMRQIRLALKLETELSKDDILNLYLLMAPFGGNIEGVRAASLSYFGKEPTHLSPAEAALLVALPQSPERRRPDRYPDVAEAARDRVLDRAVAMGTLDADEARAGQSEPAPQKRAAFPLYAPHLADHLRTMHPDRQEIVTTLDRRLQRRLEELITAGANRLNDKLSVALILADHSTGEVLAKIGSPDLFDHSREGHVDMSEAIRSPGSTLKPLIYGLAFEDGLAHPESLVEDRPTAFQGYAPENFDRVFHGTVSVRRALQMSLNIPAVVVLDAIGPVRLTTRLKEIGVEAEWPGATPPGLAIGLGGVGLSLKDLVTLYGGIANGGEAKPLHVLATADQNAGQITATDPSSKRLLSPKAAWQVADILSGVAAPRSAAHHKIAYKTGTSYGYRDAWAIGFDGQYVMGVWVGRPDGAAVPGLSGIDLAAPLLFSAFSRVTPEPVPLPARPAGTLVLAHADLPTPLRRVRHPVHGALTADKGPEIAYPPTGARIDLHLRNEGAGGFRRTQVLALKVRYGAPPFTWLVNGEPIAIADTSREIHWTPDGPGFVSISVIDAKGRAARSRAYMD